MSTITVTIEDEVLRQAERVAAEQQTTLDGLVRGYLEGLMWAHASGDEARRAQLRKDLVQALASCHAIVGEKPTRERTYSDRRFHRH